MNDRKFNHVIGLLKSWQNGYISPSAQMAIKDGVELLEEMRETIHKLRDDLAKARKIEDDLCESDDIEF